MTLSDQLSIQTFVSLGYQTVSAQLLLVALATWPICLVSSSASLSVADDSTHEFCADGGSLELLKNLQWRVRFQAAISTSTPVNSCLLGGFLGRTSGWSLPIFAEVSPAIVVDTHWLEGVSDVYPTRVADSASNDPVFLNSKDLRPLDRKVLVGSTQLFE